MNLAMTAAATLALSCGVAGSAAAAGGERVRLSGEVIDTWCYLSGVMGGAEAVVGSAHHTCALWCAAGGIPVGILGDDGKVYFLLKWEGGDVIGSGAVLDAQSARVTVDGELHRRDGLDYLLVSAVASHAGIVGRTHEDWGVVPPFAIPEVEP